MKEKNAEMILPTLDDLFSTQEQRDYQNAEKVEETKTHYIMKKEN